MVVWLRARAVYPKVGSGLKRACTAVLTCCSTRWTVTVYAPPSLRVLYLEGGSMRRPWLRTDEEQKETTASSLVPQSILVQTRGNVMAILLLLLGSRSRLAEEEQYETLNISTGMRFLQTVCGLGMSMFRFFVIEHFVFFLPPLKKTSFRFCLQYPPKKCF